MNSLYPYKKDIDKNKCLITKNTYYYFNFVVYFSEYITMRPTPVNLSRRPSILIDITSDDACCKRSSDVVAPVYKERDSGFARSPNGSPSEPPKLH